MIPTRILSYSAKMIAGYGQTGKLVKLKHYLTDAGYMSVPEMQRLTLLPKETIVTRMRMLKPNDDSMFQLDRRKNVFLPTKEWIGLGRLPRDRNLRKISPCGSWAR